MFDWPSTNAERPFLAGQRTFHYSSVGFERNHRNQNTTSWVRLIRTLIHNLRDFRLPARRPQVVGGYLWSQDDSSAKNSSIPVVFCSLRLV